LSGHDGPQYFKLTWKQTLRHKLLAREEMQTNTWGQVASFARAIGQDVWANIWNAVLAVMWPFPWRELR